MTISMDVIDSEIISLTYFIDKSSKNILTDKSEMDGLIITLNFVNFKRIGIIGLISLSLINCRLIIDKISNYIVKIICLFVFTFSTLIFIILGENLENNLFILSTFIMCFEYYCFIIQIGRFEDAIDSQEKLIVYKHCINDIDNIIKTVGVNKDNNVCEEGVDRLNHKLLMFKEKQL